LAKIALTSPNQRNSEERCGRPRARVVAQGNGWTVLEIICTFGPRDRPFEERHAQHSISLVLGGTFQYRSPLGRELMIPGSVLLGNAGQSYECSHQHAVGDRCLSFHFSPAHFQSILAGFADSVRPFPVPGLPALRSLSPVFSQACAARLRQDQIDWESIGLRLATSALDALSERSRSAGDDSPAAEARVTRVVRMIEREYDSDLQLATLAQEAKLSRYHFLRLFLRLTGLTPHQYVRRARLRRAAGQMIWSGSKVTEIALDSGFGDISNFNHAFRAEFGVSPRGYRMAYLDMRKEI